MHPIALLYKIFSEEHIPSNPLAMKLNSVIRTARQSKRDVQFLPIISKLSPMFEQGFSPLIIHSGTPPPPHNDRICDYNAMLAFLQEKISHYTTAYNPRYFDIHVMALHVCSHSFYRIPLIIICYTGSTSFTHLDPCFSLKFN